MNRITIDRLEIRVRGVSPEAARAASAGLGQELLLRLARERGLPGRGGAPAIDRLDAGSGQLPRHSNAGELRGALANQIAGAIAASGDER